MSQFTKVFFLKMNEYDASYYCINIGGLKMVEVAIIVSLPLKLNRLNILAGKTQLRCQPDNSKHLEDAEIIC